LPRAGSLNAAVRAALARAGTRDLGASVQRLMAAYRAGQAQPAPVITSRIDAAAYAAYRMPATAAATAAALREMRLSLPGWAPSSVIDFGAGTGGSAWAVASDLPGIKAITLLEQSADAIRLGRAIFAESESGVLRSATWRLWRLGEEDGGSTGAAETASGDSESAKTAPGKLAVRQSAAGPRAVPSARTSAAGAQSAGPPAAGALAADLATVCYVLSELTPAQQAALTMQAASVAPAVLLVEPGTPAGHRRILAAREQLLSSGYQIAAPCPHQLDCPLDIEGDWCHFGARLQRSAAHRQAKGVELSYEDEKFSYVAAIRLDELPARLGSPDRPSGRVVRRPQQRKGLVMLDLCRADGSCSRELVSKSKGESYRRARKTAWGDRWDP
jgi:ribosomal protein RSM22 (predicted rRNA methylase)